MSRASGFAILRHSRVRARVTPPTPPEEESMPFPPVDRAPVVSLRRADHKELTRNDSGGDLRTPKSETIGVAGELPLFDDANHLPNGVWNESRKRMRSRGSSHHLHPTNIEPLE